MDATAEAPPVIQESVVPMGSIVTKLHALSTGQAIQYQPTGMHQRSQDLFVIDLKLALGNTGIFTFVPTSNGVIITKV